MGISWRPWIIILDAESGRMESVFNAHKDIISIRTVFVVKLNLNVENLIPNKGYVKDAIKDISWVMENVYN